MKLKQAVCRLFVLCMFALVPALSGYYGVAGAEAPMVKTQAPGYYRMMLGRFEITALSDGFIDVDIKLMSNVSAAKIKAQLDRNFTACPKVKTSVNAYLINTGSQLVLVDAGGGNIFGPLLGNLLRNMKAAGYSPDQVDAALITHMHRDHVGGLITAEGRPFFPNAVVHISKAEGDFWLSSKEEAKAPAGMKRYFRMAQDVSGPYIALGRWKTFGNGDQPVPGIKAVPIFGHTPGHTAFEVKSGNDSFLIIGDMIHIAAIQFTLPDAAISFDKDQRRAISVRRALFKRAAEDKILIGGMHIPFPGIGHIRAEGAGSYTWAPIDFSPLP
jgi:glyoxylase-like metal-dependent hydrolase (beta-lactamase superfamily II)